MNKKLYIKYLSWVGIIGPLFFFAWISILGILYDGYSPISQMMSEIGAVDSPYSSLLQYGGFSELGIAWTSFTYLLLYKLKNDWGRNVGLGLIFVASIMIPELDPIIGLVQRAGIFFPLLWTVYLSKLLL